MSLSHVYFSPSSPTPPSSPASQGEILISHPSLESSIQRQSIQPVMGSRVKKQHELTTKEMEFIERFETPNTQFQSELCEVLGPQFTQITQALHDDGVVIIDQYFKGKDLEELQGFFESQIGKKPIRPFLEQASFNGGVDAKTAITESEAMSKVLADPFFILTASHHLGQPAVMANWRGYRLEPREPLLYRAWSWHNDQKRSEIKVMILLSDVKEDGQAMQVIKGSHHKWWNMESQRDTKYSLEEVVGFGNADKDDQKVTKCFGKAGTIIIFNTNMAHSGLRNLSARRDVITMNYLANIPGMPVFPSPEFHPAVADKYSSGFMASATRKETKDLEETTSTMLQDLREGKDFGVKERVAGISIAGKEKDSRPDFEAYNAIPSFSSARKHFKGTTFDELKEFLEERVLDDFGPDLDLKIRLGDGDVKRDIALARIRDARPDDRVNVKLKDFSELSINDINKEKDVDLVHLSDTAYQLQRQLESYKNRLVSLIDDLGIPEEDKVGFKERVQLLEEHIEFCGDLAEAFLRTDSVERLRTNLVFLRGLFIHSDKFIDRHYCETKQAELMKLQAYVIYNQDSNRSGHQVAKY